MSVELTPAFVLHQRPYRETSSLLDVFSLYFGRVRLVARNMRKGKQNKAGLLQLYQPLLLSWIGQGDLYTLTVVETDKPRYTLTAESALCGLYVNELIMKLLPLKMAEPQIFDAYQKVLDVLQWSDNVEVALRLFEKYLLTQLGYGLALEREVETGTLIEQTQRYYYRPDTGLYACQNDKEDSISGRSLQHLITEAGFDEESLFEIKQLMRSVIQFHLGGKPLRSRELFTAMKRSL